MYEVIKKFATVDLSPSRVDNILSKMLTPEKGGSRIAIVFNGSPLFTGDAGSGESNIRQWIIENDWLEAVVALPDQLFYNTGISTYIWVLSNRKEPRRKGKVQLIDTRRFFVKMPKSLGNKRNKIGDPADRASEPDQIADITRLFGNFQDGETRRFTEEDPVTKQPVERERVVSKIFDDADFGFHKITVERPLEEIEAGKRRQEQIRTLLARFAEAHGDEEYSKREVLPHVPDAWIDEGKTKIGYEIPLNRHFYVYEPPRPLEVIEADIKELEGEIVTLLGEVTGSNGDTA